MQLLRDYALAFVGKPYKWGGDDPVEGYDCSGFIQELLASVGIDPPGDQTAQALYDFFESRAERNRYGCGALVFYGTSVAEIKHVAMMLDQYRVIEAGGGGYRTRTKQDAADQNAYVRIRHTSHRNDIVAVLKPRYAAIGMI